MNTTQRPFTFDRVVRIVFTLVLIAGIVLLMGYLSDVLIPFAIALLLAYLINPLVTWVQKKIPNRVAAVLITLVGVLVVASILCVILLPVLMGEIGRMGEIFSKLVNDSTLAKRISEKLPPDLWKAIKDYVSQEKVQDFFKTQSFLQMAEKVAQKVLPGMWSLMQGALTVLLWLVGLTAIMLYLLFLLLDFQRVRTGWKNLVPVQYRENVVAFVNEANNAMKRYFRGQAMVASTVGFLFAIGFTLIGLPMGFLLGLFVGLLNMVPYLQIVGIVPACFLAFVQSVETGNSFWGILALVGLIFVVVQTIQDTILVPKIMGKVTGLSPAMILLSLSIWGKLLGFLGLILALPMTCLLLAYYKRLLAKEDVKWGRRMTDVMPAVNPRPKTPS